MHCCCLERDDRLFFIDDTSKDSAAIGFGLLERPRISFGGREASRTVRVLVFIESNDHFLFSERKG